MWRPGPSRSFVTVLWDRPDTVGESVRRGGSRGVVMSTRIGRPLGLAMSAIVSTTAVICAIASGAHHGVAARSAGLSTIARDPDRDRASGHIERRRVYAQFRRPARHDWPASSNAVVAWSGLPADVRPRSGTNVQVAATQALWQSAGAAALTWER